MCASVAPSSQPQRAPAPPQGPGSELYPVTEWIVTVSVRDGHVPSSWLNRMYDYAVAHGIAGAVAMEVGGRHARPHVQGLLRIRMDTTSTATVALRNHIKQFIPVQRGSQGTVMVNPLSGSQSWDHMLVYVQKDYGLAHYQLRTHNVSEEDLQRGRISYAGAVRDDPDEGRVAINKGNLPKLATRFWRTHLQPLQVPLDHTIKFVLQTDMYIPTAQWVMAPYGKGMDKARAQALFELLIGDLPHTSIEQVRSLFFGESHADPASDGMWNCSLEEVLRSARRAREHAGARDGNGAGPSAGRAFPLVAPPTASSQQNRTQRLVSALDAVEGEFRHAAELRRVRARHARAILEDESALGDSDGMDNV
jgi:hypothetical protein